MDNKVELYEKWPDKQPGYKVIMSSLCDVVDSSIDRVISPVEVSFLTRQINLHLAFLAELQLTPEELEYVLSELYRLAKIVNQSAILPLAFIGLAHLLERQSQEQ